MTHVQPSGYMASGLENPYSQLRPTMGQRGAPRSGPNWPSQIEGGGGKALATAQMGPTGQG
jgi:hypothetical protein